MNRVRILGVPVDCVNVTVALKNIEEIIAKGKSGHYIMAVNPEKVIAARKRPFLKKMFEQASFLLPDGIGVVMAMRMLHGIKNGRVAGADLMQKLCERAAKRGYRIFVYGAREAVNQKAVTILRERYPGLKIVGRCHGYVGEEQMDELIAAINASDADILFVALGSPKQEEWIDQHVGKLHVKVCQGIGGTLDVIAGNVKRAPGIFCALGLEWLYRLLAEPKRWKRQLVLPVFAGKVIQEKFRNR
jgi:N-acetylglucosaminyldiphosphoundecaprenol N-acetyl-beta-D-mannosaminyltransferase